MQGVISIVNPVKDFISVKRSTSRKRLRNHDFWDKNRLIIDRGIQEAL